MQKYEGERSTERRHTRPENVENENLMQIIGKRLKKNNYESICS